MKRLPEFLLASGIVLLFALARGFFISTPADAPFDSDPRSATELPEKQESPANPLTAPPTEKLSADDAAEVAAAVPEGSGAREGTTVETGDPAVAPVGAGPFSAAERLLARGVLREERVEAIGPGRERRLAIYDVPGEPAPIRVEETWSESEGPGTAPPRLVERHFMVADRILLDAGDPEKAEEVMAFAAAAGYEASLLDGSRSLARIFLEQPSVDAVPEALAVLAQADVPGMVAEPDYLYFPQANPNDPEIWRQWALARIAAYDAWDITTGTSDVVVAIIDSGVALTHPDLEPNLWRDENGYAGRDFVNDTDNPEDQNGHGTHVAGIAGAVGNNGVGIAGANWDVRMIALRVGNETFSTSYIVEALDYVTNLRKSGVNVVATNNSYGSESASSSLRSAIERARDVGILFVAAAGNDSMNMDGGTKTYPAAFAVDNIISVAATNSNDDLADFSNYGQADVDLAAPGASIYSTVRFHDYGYNSGTSMAAPYVTGALALMAAANPDLGAPELRERLLESVDPLSVLANKTATGGRLNVGEAVRLAAAPEVSLSLVMPQPRFLRLPDRANSLKLEAAWKSDTESTPASAVTWKTLQGPAEVEFAPSGLLTANAHFPVDGDYLIQGEWGDEGVTVATEPFLVQAGGGEFLARGLAAHWLFPEGSGATTADGSGNGRHGSLFNTSWSTGLHGNAIGFDGFSSRMTFPAPALEKITISAWVQATGPGGSADAKLPRIMETPEHILFLGMDSDGAPNLRTVKFVAEKSQSFGVWHSPPNAVSEGTWHHVTATYDGSRTDNWPSLYIDGERLPVSAQVLPAGTRSSGEGQGILGDSPQNNRQLEGLMEEVRLYDRVLHPVEIAALAAGPQQLSEAPVVSIESPGSVTAGEMVTFRGIAEDAAGGAIVPASVKWEQLSGPAEVFFEQPNAVESGIEFPLGGEYRIGFSAEDGGISSMAIIEVIVAEEQEGTFASFAAWREYYFDEPTPKEETEAMSQKDSDGDGIVDLLEYSLGLDPRRSAADRPGVLPQIGIAADDDNRYLTLTYSRPANISDVEYRVEVSNDLAGGAWESGSAHLAAEQTALQEDGSETIVVRDLTPLGAGAPQRFLRLRIVLVPEESSDPK